MIKEPENKFLWFLCKTFNMLPDDPRIENMDSNLYAYMFLAWQEDIKEKNDFAKAYSILVGSFSNPQMANKYIKRENPDFVSDEELMNKTLEEIAKPIKKKRKVING